MCLDRNPAALRSNSVTTNYLPPSSAPTRQSVDHTAGPLLLEFGTAWCGFCREAQPRIAALLTRYPHVRHVKVEDGPGRKLGRSFRVRLWPTLVFLHDGVIIRQLARPTDDELEEAFTALARARVSPL
jgi:thioredoxin 1